METLVLIGLICAIVLFLIGLAFILRGIELLFPAVTRFLDRHVGEEPGEGRWE